MSLKKIIQNVDNVGVYIWGNRVTALGAGVIGATHYLEIPLLEVALFVGGTGLLGLTECGFGTLGVYIRTKRHIQNNGGHLDKRFVKNLILGSENTQVLGYCQQQGCYLAARNTGNLETFEKVKDEYSNIKIPFF